MTLLGSHSNLCTNQKLSVSGTEPDLFAVIDEKFTPYNAPLLQKKDVPQSACTECKAKITVLISTHNQRNMDGGRGVPAVGFFKISCS